MPPQNRPAGRERHRGGYLPLAATMIRLMHVHTLFDMSGKVALVTGGSRGLGLEMAIGCGEAGAAVAITARRETWLRAAEEEIRARGIDGLSVRWGRTRNPPHARRFSSRLAPSAPQP